MPLAAVDTFLVVFFPPSQVVSKALEESDAPQYEASCGGMPNRWLVVERATRRLKSAFGSETCASDATRMKGDGGGDGEDGDDGGSDGDDGDEDDDDSDEDVG